MSSTTDQIIDISINIKTPVLSADGFGVPAIIYSRDGAVTKRVYTFTSADSMLTDVDLVAGGLTETTPAYLQALSLFLVGPNDNNPSKFKVILRDTTDNSGEPTETLTEALDAAAEEDSAFYGVLMPEHGLASLDDNVEVGEWVNANTRIFTIVSDDPAIKTAALSETGTDLAQVFKNAANGRTFVIANNYVDKFPDAITDGRNLPYDPGAVNWKFTRATSGIVIGETLSESVRILLDGDGDATVESKNVNYFQIVNKISMMTSSCRASNGDYIDLVRGIDWMKVEIATDMLNLFLENPKIPMTNAGINLIDSTLKGSLESAKSNLIITSYTTSVPDESEVPDEDRLSRCLTGVTFEAQASNGVNKVTIRGTILI